MDFARKQLEKYGWKEGQGLGKNEDGITKPIKASLKFDNTGIGHKHGAEFTNNWWEKLYNNASQNIEVNVANERVNLSRKSDPIEITTRNYSIKKEDKDSLYGSFLKTSRLTSKGTEDYERPPVIEEPPKKKFENMTDEELFAACGGRTAHKGARHGLRLSGKLARIEKQERLLLKKMKGCSLDDNNKVLKKMRKLKSQKETMENEDTNDSVEPISDSSCSSVKKKKKKGRKTVSFSDRILEYMIPTSESNVEHSPNPIGENETLNSDEGIEKDIEDHKIMDNGHKSFEEPQFIASDLSSAEKKKLKKKRKLEGKQRATTKFIQAIRDEEMEDISATQDCKKRKLNLAEAKFSECKRSQSELESPDVSSKKPEKKKKHKKSKKSEKNKNSEEQKLKYISASLQNMCKISEDD